jgi:hypothetical protein
MYIYIYIHIYVCICMYIYICICMYIYIYIYMYIYIYIYIYIEILYIFIYLFRICIYIYIYIYIHTYTVNAWYSYIYIYISYIYLYVYVVYQVTCFTNAKVQILTLAVRPLSFFVPCADEAFLATFFTERYSVLSLLAVLVQKYECWHLITPTSLKGLGLSLLALLVQKYLGKSTNADAWLRLLLYKRSWQRVGHAPAPQFTCFTGTKVQILTPDYACFSKSAAADAWAMLRHLKTAFISNLEASTWYSVYWLY